jgi:hypothetical protein
MCGAIRRTLTNKTAKDTQVNFYKFMAVPTLFVDVKLGHWKEVIETADMRFLRHVAGCIRRDEISNLTICSELQIFNVNDKVIDKRKELDDHIQRTDPCRIASKAVDYKPIGHRDVGRPKRRFLYGRNRSYGLPWWCWCWLFSFKFISLRHFKA